MSTPDVAANKAATIERCVKRAREVYAADIGNLTHDPLKQDSIVLNLQRACEAAIDLAMHLVRVRRLGIPQESRQAFDMLADADVLPAPLARTLKAMVGFRNIAVHDYRKIDLDIVRAILERHRDELLAFAGIALKTSADG